MSVGVMKDYKIKMKNLHVSDQPYWGDDHVTLIAFSELWTNPTNFYPLVVLFLT
jgi:hypothetical protein